MPDANFKIIDSPELVTALRSLVGRFRRAIDARTATRGER